MSDKSKKEKPSNVLDKIKAVIDKAGLGEGADLEAYYKIKAIMRKGT